MIVKRKVICDSQPMNIVYFGDCLGIGTMSVCRVTLTENVDCGAGCLSKPHFLKRNISGHIYCMIMTEIFERASINRSMQIMNIISSPVSDLSTYVGSEGEKRDVFETEVTKSNKHCWRFRYSSIKKLAACNSMFKWRLWSKAVSSSTGQRSPAIRKRKLFPGKQVHDQLIFWKISGGCLPRLPLSEYVSRQ
jgi:hypothetical protein